MTNNSEELKKKFEEFKELKFPSIPSDLDISAELSLEDGNLAGYITSHLAHSRIDFHVWRDCFSKQYIYIWLVFNLS